MTPYQAVLYSAAIYDPVNPGVFSQVFRIGEWRVGYGIDRDGNPVFAIPGSQSERDFMADGYALPVNAGPLGMVHAGFYLDAPAVLAALRPLIVGKLTICGHSLGASRAAILAGLCAAAGIPVAQLYMFEPARPGYQQLADLVTAHVPDILGTCNARDFVPDLPPPWPMPYQHIVDLIDLKNPATGIDPLNDHMLAAVISGVLKRWPE